MQLTAIRDVTRRPAIRALIRPALAGELVNQLRNMAVWIEALLSVNRSLDPFDNFLLSMAEGRQADVLVSGDKRGVLGLKSHGTCRIATVRKFAEIVKHS